MSLPRTEAPEPPQPRLLDLLSRFITRTDELLGYLAEMEKRREARDERVLKALESLGGVRAAAVAVERVTVSPEVKDLITQIVNMTVTTMEEVVREVIAKPTGKIRNYGSETTTDSYATVVKLKPKQGSIFKPTKMLVSCPEDVMCQLKWGGEELGPEIYVMAKLPFTDWFPYGFRTKQDKDLAGDGNQEFELTVKYPSGGTAATCHAEISGDEEPAPS